MCSRERTVLREKMNTVLDLSELELSKRLSIHKTVENKSRVFDSMFIETSFTTALRRKQPRGLSTDKQMNMTTKAHMHSRILFIMKSEGNAHM